MKLPLFLFRARVFFTLAVVSLTAVFLYRTYISVDSVAAVVCAHRISVSAPISGSVTARAALAVGARVQRGKELFHLVNRRLDERALIETRQAVAQAEAEVERLRRRLDAERGTLARVERGFTAARASQVAVLTRRLDGSALKASELAAQLRYLEHEQVRRDVLAAAEVLSRSEQEAHSSEVDSQRARLAAQQSEVTAAEQLLDAVRRGEVIEDAFLPSVRDLQERRADATETIAALNADLRGAERRLDALRAALEEQSALAARLREAALVASTNGVVVEVAAGLQEDVANGDPLVAYVNCEELYVMAVVRGRVYREAGAGRLRSARVAIGSTDYPGVIIAVDPRPFPRSGITPSAEAVIPKPDSAGEYGYVLVRMDPTAELAERCPVGALANVSLRP